MSPARLRTRRTRARDETGRRRAAPIGIWQRGARTRPLLESVDHGDPILVSAHDVEARDREQWVEPFLTANRSQLQRLRLEAETRVGRDGVRIALHPRERIGAVPLLAPCTRRVVAGLLVKPRFGWTSVGNVLGSIGYRIEPEVGGAPLVPGSAREVPPWILAGTVLVRIRRLLERLGRQFGSADESRRAPRGRVDWTDYARRSLPSGHWDRFRCIFSDLREDPWLLAALRWTLERLTTDLAPTAGSPIGQRLLEDARILVLRLGLGPSERAGVGELERALGDPVASDFLRAAVEAMGWVRDERGLGGLRTLEGLAWSLATDTLWEAWVESVLAEVARRLGARVRTAREGATRRPLVWQTPLRSLGHLAPDLVLEMSGRTVWVDAKYKAHLLDLHRFGWDGLSERVRDAHRADVHQALAYAALSSSSDTETWLVYPTIHQDALGPHKPEFSEAAVTSGERRVRLVLASLPFGFAAPSCREALVATWEHLLRG